MTVSREHSGQSRTISPYRAARAHRRRMDRLAILGGFFAMAAVILAELVARWFGGRS